ncbi:hypothetical protein [Sporomusa sp.]|uniref:hypothetical protein n=1 Tax=Sporomusa sp. TaxID=2078658 RepID=UPI002C64B095|nr:hypothetical protein [Sporomusa sp.]HWR45145.1 hypothetical protein [Sporomusa sp.]
MNKLKLMYDVVKTLRSKEVIAGVFTADVQKDQAKIFSLQNEFEKNLITCQVKAKINTELDYDGKLLKHESNSEFTLPHFCGHSHHQGRPLHHHGHAFRHGGIKGKLTRLSLALSILNAVQAAEQENKTIVLSLNANDLPEDMKVLLREKISHADAHHPHHGLMKEFCTVDQLNFVVNVFINKNYEIEKVVATLGGSRSDEHHEQHDLNARVELSFTW